MEWSGPTLLSNRAGEMQSGMPCTQIHSHYAAAVTLAAIGYTHHQWMDGWVGGDRQKRTRGTSFGS